MNAHIPKDPNATASYNVESNAPAFTRVAMWGESIEQPVSDMPSTLLQAIQDKIARGEDEGPDEDVFRSTLDRAISPEKPDQES